MKARQQRVVVEHNEGDWLVMHDSGAIEIHASAADVLRAVSSRARRGNTTVTITAIEWRGVPVGFVPPKP